MDKKTVDASVQTLQGLERIGEIIELHNKTWKNSPGIIDLLKNSSRCFVLIDSSGKLIGYAFAEDDRDRGYTELQDIAVSSSCQNSGGGALLMQAVMNCSSRVKLIARLNNQPLIRFYTRLGFKQETVIENYYNIGEDGVRMSWSR